MAATPSTMLELGTKAPDFSLKDTEGNTITRDSFEGYPGLLVIFMCNHCPFVKHIQEKLTEVTADYMQKNLGIVGINANDAEKYPDDSPEKMAEEKVKAGYPFPYLYDADQEVAKAYHAACTPDFFLFDKEMKLVYRGQFDDSRPGNDKPVTGEDLKAAMDAVLDGEDINFTQKPSIGCNIKWKPGNEPDYFK
ncbi:MAG: thioredoxin family protein [Candidatus Sumerlaeia bacterium]